MQMTPNRKKYYPPERREVGVVVTSTNGAGYHSIQRERSLSRQSQQQERREQFSPTILRNNLPEVKYQQQHPRNKNNSPNLSQNAPPVAPHKINRNDKEEFIPLFVLADACRENSERKVREICRKLLLLEKEEAEPVVNFQDQTGRTALSYGCGCGSMNLIEEVCKFRFTDPNLADNDGNAPLHYLAVCGHYEGIDFLVRRFCNVIDLNVRNASGLTPLMKAGLQGRTRCAKRLLSAGASPFLKDHIRGLTAAEWAKLCGRHMCEEIINRSASGAEDKSHTGESSHVRSHTEESQYYLSARSTVNGAKWLKNKIKKVLGTRSGPDKSYVYNNPVVKSLEDTRPHEHFTVMTNIGLGGAAICASSLLLPDVQPMLRHQKQRTTRATKKLSIPAVQITPVRR